MLQTVKYMYICNLKNVAGKKNAELRVLKSIEQKEYPQIEWSTHSSPYTQVKGTDRVGTEDDTYTMLDTSLSFSFNIR